MNTHLSYCRQWFITHLSLRLCETFVYRPVSRPEVPQI